MDITCSLTACGRVYNPQDWFYNPSYVVNRNVNHIIRCFKKDLGITPHKYIAMMKVNLAIAYMREGKSRTEIADQLGFESLSAFSHFFHHETKTMQSS